MSRDEVVEALSGGIEGIPAVKSIERLAPKPGDVIVVTYPDRLRGDTMAHIREGLETAFSPARVLVLDGGPEVKIVKAAE